MDYYDTSNNKVFPLLEVNNTTPQQYSAKIYWIMPDYESNGIYPNNRNEKSLVIGFIIKDSSNNFITFNETNKNIVNKSNIVEVGQGFSISLKEMIYVASEISNSRCELKFGSLELEDDLINDSFAQKSYLLREWRPKYSLKEGLTKCLNAKNVHY